MTFAETIHEIGPLLFGSTWQSEMARYLGVSARTVRRWAAGTEVPGEWVRERLHERQREKAAQMEALMQMIDTAPREGFRP